MKKIEGFDVEAYKRRLTMLREIVSGENQAEFAERLGVPFKRWNNYERGYPVPRETAFLIMHKFPGMSVEWLWFGHTGNLSEHYRERIKIAETLARETAHAQAAVEKAQLRLNDIAKQRAKALEGLAKDKAKATLHRRRATRR
ncbi:MULTISPECIES: helix-turn-helix domain-containing protein [unclassified Bradyrhizobium]|uniref:helix-turn-helix domain-containing protein n=1 Tax=unclassified Bradyrhizobium TaxID=2631580 RepID=UPI002FF27A63